MCKGATGVTKKKLPPVPREVARKYAVQRRGEGKYQELLPQEDYEEEPAGKHELEPAGNAEARTAAEKEPAGSPPSKPPSTPPWNCILLAIRAHAKKPLAQEQTPTVSTGIITAGAFDDSGNSLIRKAEECGQLAQRVTSPETARRVSRVQERATKATQRAEARVERLLARVQARVDAISGSEPVSEKDDPLLHHPLLASRRDRGQGDRLCRAGGRRHAMQGQGSARHLSRPAGTRRPTCSSSSEPDRPHTALLYAPSRPGKASTGCRPRRRPSASGSGGGGGVLCVSSACGRVPLRAGARRDPGVSSPL
ncbi:hypothetical protein EMIHUDRAFT_442120 [Emiliania huxleyi CCMP1516]|uniref:Ribosome biogenesis protein NOP53 n=2 Tax=Emiliania huxleyi TaxID=2903 RepID=A0A0D3K7F5_EMIH1|nr:hypothetical protein EMIHUDRAFT_442120 [Emiliania huxleyi CCMP1516]EOD31690.1 hypothetical protein EMIHUDRAFT_442120 [Emiliania huxleyi CCMP1516]|eukprot:XP_005784119.1 hypothetical protein EMIHUDRAFT_442120 [Emiliania huxleyi CCMP1516]